jgi:hypothetical protein
MLIFQAKDSTKVSVEECQRWSDYITEHMDGAIVLPPYIDFICESHNIEYVDTTEDNTEEEGEE